MSATQSGLVCAGLGVAGFAGYVLWSTVMPGDPRMAALDTLGAALVATAISLLTVRPR